MPIETEPRPLRLRVHPVNLLGDADWFTLRLWSRQRGGDRAVSLPFAGGYADQPAYLIGAFSTMDAVAADIEAAKRQREELKKRR